MRASLLVCRQPAPGRSHCAEAFLGSWSCCRSSCQNLSLSVWSLVNIVIVTRGAEHTAGGRPYCLQVPATRLGAYAAITGAWQLASLRMQNPVSNGGRSTDYQFAFHAVLVAENGYPLLFSWSYRIRAFLRISDRTRSGMAMYRNCAT